MANIHINMLLLTPIFTTLSHDFSTVALLSTVNFAFISILYDHNTLKIHFEKKPDVCCYLSALIYSLTIMWWQLSIDLGSVSIRQLFSYRIIRDSFLTNQAYCIFQFSNKLGRYRYQTSQK